MSCTVFSVFPYSVHLGYDSSDRGLHVYGGLVSVVWTETLQSVLLLAGALSSPCSSPSDTRRTCGGNRDGDRAHLFLPLDHPELPWTAILVLIFSRMSGTPAPTSFTFRCVWERKMNGTPVWGGVCNLPGIFLDSRWNSPALWISSCRTGSEPAPSESNEIYPYLIRYIVPAGIRESYLRASSRDHVHSERAYSLNRHSLLNGFLPDVHPAESIGDSSHKVGQTAGLYCLRRGYLCSFVELFPLFRLLPAELGNYGCTHRDCCSPWVLSGNGRQT